MYFWVDEVLNVFVLGKPNPAPLYPGILRTLDIKSPSFFKLLKHCVRNICSSGHLL